MSKLNSKTLTIAAVVLVVLALFFMATPLLRVSGFSARPGFNQRSSGLPNQGGQDGFPGQGGNWQSQGFPGQAEGSQGQGNATTGGGFGLGGLGFTFMNGMTGIIVYAVALLASLAAAAGMVMKKRWGQVLGIVMGVVYLGMSLVSLLPMILMAFMQVSNGLNLSLGILRAVLAIAVIVFAAIPAGKPTVMTTTVLPPEASG